MDFSKSAGLAVLLFAVLVGECGSVAWSPPRQAATASSPASAPPAPETRLYPLMVGDVAPPLAIERWIKGSPVVGFEKGRVYVVEFWATWCGPCLSGMAHLTELQKRHAKDGLSVIGVTSRDDYGNTLEAATSLVSKKGDQVGYAIAWDDQTGTDHAYQQVFRGRTMEAYLEAARIRSIPCSFVIDRQGRVAYIGHPLALDEVLPAVVGGTWDLAAAATRYRLVREAEPQLEEFEKLLEAEKYDDAYVIARRLMANQVKDDARGLLIISNAIGGPESTIKKRDLPLALEAALRANELTRYGDPGLLSTLASVYFRSGQVEKAIEFQTRAVAIAEGGMKAGLEKLLDGYKRR